MCMVLAFLSRLRFVIQKQSSLDMAPVVSPCSYLHVWISWRRRSNIASITDAVTLSHVITTFQSFENVMARATSPGS
mgnify:CR=1 FL=1